MRQGFNDYRYRTTTREPLNLFHSYENAIF
jgi:hypothetical protein